MSGNPSVETDVLLAVKHRAETPWIWTASVICVIGPHFVWPGVVVNEQHALAHACFSSFGLVAACWGLLKFFFLYRSAVPLEKIFGVLMGLLWALVSLGYWLLLWRAIWRAVLGNWVEH